YYSNLKSGPEGIVEHLSRPSVRSIVLAVAVLVVIPLASNAQKKKFNPGCPLPPALADIAETQAIDKVCSINGESTADEKVAESKAKNNLCVTGEATPITYNTLVELQASIDADHFPLGDRSHPKRPAKKYSTSKGKFGEGDLVTLAAW